MLPAIATFVGGVGLAACGTAMGPGPAAFVIYGLGAGMVLAAVLTVVRR